MRLSSASRRSSDWKIESTAEKLVESGIEVGLGGLEMAVAIVVLSSLVFLFDARNEVGDWIDRERLRCLRFALTVGSCCRLRLSSFRRRCRSDERWSLGLRWRHKGLLLRALAGERRHQPCTEENRRIPVRGKPHRLRKIERTALWGRTSVLRPRYS